ESRQRTDADEAPQTSPGLVAERIADAEPHAALLDLVLRRVRSRPDRARVLDCHVREEERDHDDAEDHGEQLNEPLSDEHDEVALIPTHQPSPSSTQRGLVSSPHADAPGGNRADAQSKE